MLKAFIKRSMKLVGKHFPRNSVRKMFLRLAGYRIGRNVYIGEDLIVCDELTDRGNIIIDDRVAIAERVTLVTVSNPNKSKIAGYAPTAEGSIHIERDAWIGSGAIILPNTTVGEGAVVGAGSVVLEDVAAYTVVAGAPARVLRKLDREQGGKT